MTKYVGEFGKRWDARVPRNHLRWLMGRVHVGATDEQVEAEVRKRIGDDKRFTPSLVRQTVRYAIECHHQNQKLYDSVMRGGQQWTRLL